MEKTGWLGEDVWYAHGIWFDDAEIAQLAATGTHVAHCPASNLRLGSGICKVPQLLDAGVNVALAVDGSASNDASSMTREMQLALLVHRVGTGVGAMPAQRVLRMATRGGAKLLGRDEIGQLEPGAAADLAVFRLDRVDFAGAMHDPASAILYCGSGVRADYTIVAGKVLVEAGRLVGIDEERLFHRANEIAARLVGQAERTTGVSYLDPPPAEQHRPTRSPGCRWCALVNNAHDHDRSCRQRQDQPRHRLPDEAGQGAPHLRHAVPPARGGAQAAQRADGDGEPVRGDADIDHRLRRTGRGGADDPRQAGARAGQPRETVRAASPDRRRLRPPADPRAGQRAPGRAGHKTTDPRPAGDGRGLRSGLGVGGGLLRRRPRRGGDGRRHRPADGAARRRRRRGRPASAW